MPHIARLSPAARAYLANFEIMAVCVDSAGRVEVRRDPGGFLACWWCDQAVADRVASAARQAGGDIVRAARKLGVPITPHAVVLARVEAAIARIEAGIAQMESSGGLKFFNHQYRQRRLEAQLAGRPFMSYRSARARLGELIGGVPAGRLPAAIVDEVFGADP